ncbi:MAG: hypothetical protein K2I57_00435 [Muribaculaceae bacterium]|nr:hypothetical protein [Muribaculaceae bacterium]
MKKNNNILQFVLTTLSILLVSTQSNAQERHLYFKGDISSPHLITEATSIGITALINRSTGQFTYDNIFNIPITSGDLNGNSIKLKTISHYGLSLNDIFNNFGTGIKLGYKTDNFGFFNFATFGSAHYRFNNISLSFPNSTDYYDNSIHRIQFGIGANMTLGRIDQSARVTIEFGARYNIPIGYSGELGDGTGCLNSGITPIFAITVGGPKLMKKMGMNIGLHFEFMSYDWFKESEHFTNPYTINTWNLGLNLTMCPWK